MTISRFNPINKGLMWPGKGLKLANIFRSVGLNIQGILLQCDFVVDINSKANLRREENPYF